MLLYVIALISFKSFNSKFRESDQTIPNWAMSLCRQVMRPHIHLYKRYKNSSIFSCYACHRSVIGPIELIWSIHVKTHDSVAPSKDYQITRIVPWRPELYHERCCAIPPKVPIWFPSSYATSRHFEHPLLVPFHVLLPYRVESCSR